MSHSEVTCRSCGRAELEPVLSLGRTPLADALLTKEQVDKIDELELSELIVPLEWVFCPHCALVQITESASPEILFGKDYPYFSSVSKSLLQHFRQSAEELIDSRKLHAGSIVVEAASNDGYMLRNFVERGIPVLGIDPAATTLDDFSGRLSQYCYTRPDGEKEPERDEVVLNYDVVGNRISVYSFAGLPETQEHLRKLGIRAEDISEEAMSLEDAFIGITGKY